MKNTQKNRKTTQTQRVLCLLKKKRKSGATPLELWQKCGCYRASSAVLALRKKGYNIITEDVIVKNQFGESCRVARYILK